MLLGKLAPPLLVSVWSCVLARPITIVRKAILCFPSGPPARGVKWLISPGVPIREYIELLEGLFLRSIPTPISDNMYGCHLFSRFVM